MPCLYFDPSGPYSERLFAALKEQGGEAVAVFTTRTRHGIWHGKWKAKLGDRVVGEYPLDDYDTLDRLADALKKAWPELSGVVPWDEDNVVVGAALSDLLSLGWNTPEVIQRCRDKGAMKRWLRDHGDVRINDSRVVRNGYEALEFCEEHGRWPMVVKPTGGSGSENVYFADGPGALLRRCQQVLESEAGEVLLEEYVGGEELAVNGLVDGSGALKVTDVWLYDRRESHGVPNLYYEVSSVPTLAPVFSACVSYAERVVAALGLRRAPIHMEVKVDRLGPCLIEVGARFGGISLPILASKLHGRDLFAAALKHYLEVAEHNAADFDFGAYDAGCARVVLGIQEEGLERIESVEGVEEVEALPSFSGWGLLRGVGGPAPQTEDLDGRSWEVLLCHADPDQVARDAKTVRSVLRYS